MPTIAGLLLEKVLKEGERRSVRLERDAAGQRTVVKRFSAPSLAAATLDRVRAAREHRLLSELRDAGVRVPQALGLERVDGGWEVRMEWLGASATAADLLEGRAPWPRGRAAGCRELGILLATLHARGVDHPDLHPGNALVSADGRAWAIDFHKARRVKALRERTLRRDLASLAASARETLTPFERARFFLAWHSALPAELRPDTPRALLAREIETSARERRVAVVHKRRLRRLRTSSTVEKDERDFSGYVRHGFDAERLGRLARTALARGPGLFAGLVEPGVLVVTGISERQARRIFVNAARALEHRLPAARPLALAREPRPWVALEVPEHSLPATVPQALRSTRSLHSLGKLCAGLFDRALRPRSSAGPLFWIAGTGEVVLGAVLELERDATRAGGVDTVRALSLAGLSISELSPRERAAFAAGLLAGSGLAGAAREALRAELRHG
ncbi:MAG: hypothetical protein NTV21_19345 [Planctomycetota bacterium]|nr:hypothetical protein [Planctomycetota bacterium]